MRFADFDGDGRCDIFRRDADGSWYVKYVGTSGGWTSFGHSTSCNLETMRFHDFDGDGRCDIWRLEDGEWQVCRTGVGGWMTIATSGTPLDRLAFGDFDGDGKTDVIAAR